MYHNNDIKYDDELLTRFFNTARQDIDDDGFTTSVMQRLPQRAKRMNNIWTTMCVALGMAMFILLDGMNDLRVLGSNMLGNMAGYIASIDLPLLSPSIILGAIATLGFVWLYNILSIPR